MKLTVVVGTYNRVELLKKCIASIFFETKIDVKVYITDAGSTDGTIEYLQSIANETVIPIFLGRKIGQAKAYNEIFERVDTPYVCWLSDDNMVVNNGLDIAVKILFANPGVGMVALKTKDVQGPFEDAPYIGGLSSIGILNVNQGVLPTKILKKVGGFSEEFRDYGIDPDLTAKVFFSGYKIVYTKKVALHHYRNWAEDTDSDEYKVLKKKQQRSMQLYWEKYSKFLDNGSGKNKRPLINVIIEKVVKKCLVSNTLRNKSIVRDLNNILNAQYISPFDLLSNFGKKYYLVQNPPSKGFNS